ncbi:NAD(P)/FAD-dependent oxidoreductase [uncultured Jatrophihabitans sp.]|uniref:NAD(P)/FAD-dependent oxidoreductase n=1 Tax=uncultured Jatrophihabitans sp. TaxID=1610747 RepID=UPI0035CAA579
MGAGVAGAACAARLRRAGLEVDVLERGRAPGGRLASPEIRNRRVDLGAAYFTVADESFRSVVDDWADRGLARSWTDTVDAFSADGRQTKRGPMRWAARSGLRSLVHDLLPDPVLGVEVDDIGALPHDAVVLAMPDPQAARLAGDTFDWVEFEPVIAVALGWDERCWPIADAAFVNDDPDITLVADDGARRGDGAPVLVAHTTAELARTHLAAPDGAIEPVRAALTRVLGVGDEPWWTHAHRWTYAKPAGTHGDEPYGLSEAGSRPLGVCGDAWCPSGSPRVEAAWLSGSRLGAELAAALS